MNMYDSCLEFHLKQYIMYDELLYVGYFVNNQWTEAERKELEFERDYHVTRFCMWSDELLTELFLKH